MQVSAFAGTTGHLRQVVQDVVNSELPTQMGTVTNTGGRRLLKTGATQYWIIAPSADNPLGSLKAAISPHIGVVVSLTHSRTCIEIDGASAGDLLAMSIALDLHPSTFGVGQFALTGLHHMPAMVHRIRADCFELYVMRTFAQSIWRWIADAALSFEHVATSEANR